MSAINSKHYLILLLALSACNSTSTSFEGLWQLGDYKMDEYSKPFEDVFIQFNQNKTFAVAKKNGDLSGLYNNGAKTIELTSNGTRWYNMKWSYMMYPDDLILSGKDEIGRHLKLRFKRTKKIPNYEEFENKVIGQWEIFNSRSKEGKMVLINLTMTIDSAGRYTISNSYNIMETGSLEINTRHQKIIFTSEEKIWNAWFYGPELRLKNQDDQIQYSLRKIIN
ncbi:MAG: hypothetical protein OCD76_04225 [Reichenbachiella sp.]